MKEWKFEIYKSQTYLTLDELEVCLKLNKIPQPLKILFEEVEKNSTLLNFLTKFDCLFFVEERDVFRCLRKIVKFGKKVNLNTKQLFSPYSILSLPYSERVKLNFFPLIENVRFDLKKLTNFHTISTIIKIEKFDDKVRRELINSYLYYSPTTYILERKVSKKPTKPATKSKQPKLKKFLKKSFIKRTPNIFI